MISKHRIRSNIHRYGGMHPYSHMRITYSEAHQNTDTAGTINAHIPGLMLKYREHTQVHT